MSLDCASSSFLPPGNLFPLTQSGMNKDEAEKCLSISKTKYRAGDRDGAMKFALKSVKLLETREGVDWVRMRLDSVTFQPANYPYFISCRLNS